MELVYLWVEEYKNIKNQGFNFSPKFECEFKAEYDENEKLKNDCDLIIKENKDYVSIFPDNINFTAIVGENGTGKSSILNFILELLENNDNNYNNYNNNILIVRNNNVNFNISNFLKKDGLEDLLLKKFIKQITYYSYSNTFQKKSNAIFLSKKEINNHLMKLSDKSFKLTSFMYLPEKINVKLISSNERLKRFFENDKYLHYFLNLSSSNRNKPIGIIKKEFEEDFLKITDDYKKFLVIEYLKKQNEIPNIKSLKNRWIKKMKNEINRNLFIKYFKNIENNFSELKTEEKQIYLKYMDSFEFDFTDEKKRKYSELSHGEQILFGQMVNIYSYSLEQNTNLIFLFDEPEISLHPNWQKRYIQELSNLVRKLEKNYHFIFATHSPFLLSDIPKENIIFLEKYTKDEDINQKNGNCKNISKKIKLKTFGANIHSLLSDGFFMSDGLMGEFAKNKVNEIKKFYELMQKLKKRFNKYNLEERTKNLFIRKKTRFDNIRKTIGEPFLQTIIKNYLDELNEIFDNRAHKKKKKNELLKQFSKEELQKYLDEMK